MFLLLLVHLISIDEHKISTSLIAISFCICPGILLYYQPWAACTSVHESLSFRFVAYEDLFILLTFRHHRIMLAGIEKRSADVDMITKNLEKQLDGSPESKVPSKAASTETLK